MYVPRNQQAAKKLIPAVCVTHTHTYTCIHQVTPAMPPAHVSDVQRWEKRVLRVRAIILLPCKILPLFNLGAAL